ncbi:GntR family transcriptional regulator [Leuconostocaceae bacterium ESL0723]|nr:GntR family transcriptional regulator [Lactobacillaceae bacterium L1_55_11]WEV54210.1 GntR family transcriptional regulator [Leuconostocaceae bacterium ESL0723]
MAIPRYIQIHNEIRERIAAGEWKTNQRLPAERDLAEDFKVSRMTLRQAIQTLVDEGILERKVGSGTYVAKKKISERALGMTSFTELLEKTGHQPQTVTISYKVTTPSVSQLEHLQLKPDDEVLVMERLRLGDDEPILLEQTTLPVKLVENFTRSSLTESLYATLIEAGIQPGRAEQTVTATLATERLADLLDIKRGDPILSVRQVSYDQNNVPFEYVQSFYVGERFEFKLIR